MQVESRKGNTITRNADEDNPAVRVERQGDGNNQDVVKRMTELTKVGEEKEKEGEGEENGAGVGEKREREAMEKEHETEKAGQVNEPQDEKSVEDKPQDEKAVEDKEPETKRAQLDETSQEEKKPGPKSTRGRGRGRGKTASTTTTGARRGGRPKKEPRKKSAGTGQVEDANDEAVNAEKEASRRSQDPHN